MSKLKKGLKKYVSKGMAEHESDTADETIKESVKKQNKKLWDDAKESSDDALEHKKGKAKGYVEKLNRKGSKLESFNNRISKVMKDRKKK